MSAPSAEAGDGPGRGPVYALALVLGLTALAYWNVLDADFIAVDDDFYVYDNPRVLNGITDDSVVWAFTEAEQANWIPLTLLTYLVDAELFGADPAGFHFTSLVLHLLGTGLLFFALNALTGAPWRSVVVAALFALHPVHVESVAWVSSRKDVLSGVFFFLTLLVYARYTAQKSIANYALVLISFALALMSKPVVLTLPFVLLLLDFWPLRRFALTRSSGRELFSCVGEKVPLFALTGLFLALTFVMQDKADAYGANLKYSLWERTQNAIVGYAQYVMKFVWPVDLAPMYPLPLEPYPVWMVASAGLFLLFVTVVVVARPPAHAPALVGWLLFLGMLVPMAGFIQVGNQAYADRYTYLPYVGLSLVVVWPLAAAAKRAALPQRAVAALAGAVLVVLAGLTHAQAKLWRDTETLFAHTLDVTEDNAFAHHTLAFALGGKGDLAGAIEQYRRAIALVPGYFNAHVHLAQTYERSGDAGLAEAHYIEALKYKPLDARANNAYGSLLARSGRPEAALPYFSRALEVYGNDPMLNSNVGLALQDLGRHEEALPYLMRAAELRSDWWPYAVNCAFSLEALGRVEEAERIYAAGIQQGVEPEAIAERRDRLGLDSR